MRGTLTTGPSTETGRRLRSRTILTTGRADTGQTRRIRRRWTPYAVLVAIALIMFGMTYAARVTPTSGVEYRDAVSTASPQPGGGT
jgi:hypothetical protein